MARQRKLYTAKNGLTYYLAPPSRREQSANYQRFNGTPLTILRDPPPGRAKEPPKRSGPLVIPPTTVYVPSSQLPHPQATTHNQADRHPQTPEDSSPV
jgi:hypothetical protein